VVASLAWVDVSPSKELMDLVWAAIGPENEQVSIWKVLCKLPAPRAGRSVEVLLEKIAGVQQSIRNTIEYKKYRQTAELGSTEAMFWKELNEVRLGADGDDSAHKVTKITQHQMIISGSGVCMGCMFCTSQESHVFVGIFS